MQYKFTHVRLSLQFSVICIFVSPLPLAMEMGRLNNMGDHTVIGDDRNLEPLLPRNGKGGDNSDGANTANVEKETPKKKKRPKKKSSVLQAKLNHLAGVIGQVGRSLLCRSAFSSLFF